MIDGQINPASTKDTIAHRMAQGRVTPKQHRIGWLRRKISMLTSSLAKRNTSHQTDRQQQDLGELEAMDGDSEAPSGRILLEPYKYLLQLPGKQVRTKLSQAFNHWLNVPEDKLQVIIQVTEMLHNASLLIDDIEDSSKLRRGFPVAHSIYGIPSVINSANYVYFLGLEKVLTLEHPEAVRVFTRQLLELHRGQGLDIHWRDTYTCPTEQEYRNMVLQKTGGLFGLAVGLMQLFSDWKQDLKPLLDTLGLFFQIRDDYAQPELSTQVQNILRQRTENMDIKRYCVDYLEKVGSFAYTRQTLRDLEEEVYRLIGEFGGNPQLESLVKHLSQMHREAEAAAESSTEPHSNQNH
ncbi:hypothetical protein PFLUV_G00225280 [Perca fluviatilis]|uniref:Geranylgeranyl pyrophosphate synthase n=1 Tax=Perca fluviatilis TaxID=8168 RepID=A0A6A5DRW0_PERFL|nr:hypothetical protein PFLUV_G00225280 [Perca fluviatilis]